MSGFPGKEILFWGPILQIVTQWVHVSTAVNKVVQILVDGSFIACISLFWFWRPKWITSTKSKFAVRMDSGHKWRLASHNLLSLCCCCPDWMLRISSSVWNDLISFDWFRTGAEHTTQPFIDSWLLNIGLLHDSIVRVLTRPKWQGAAPCGFGSRPVVSHLRPVVSLP